MAVIIANARIDENGRISGGRLGDQTGKEVLTQTWYNTAVGWDVFRPIDPEVAERIAQDAEWGCANKNIGYGQSRPDLLYMAAEPYGFNLREIKSPTQTDCSGLARVCIAYGGIYTPDFYTGNEAETLLATGAFIRLPSSKVRHSSDYLRRGDIGVTYGRKGHTWIAVSDGKRAYEWGSTLTLELQEKFATPADGEIWGQYSFNKRYLPNAGDGWKWSLFAPKGSALIKQMQNILRGLGFYKGDLDGIAGKLFVTALQQFLNAQGYSLDTDGIMGCATVKALTMWTKTEHLT